MKVRPQQTQEVNRRERRKKNSKETTSANQTEKEKDTKK